MKTPKSSAFVGGECNLEVGEVLEVGQIFGIIFNAFVAGCISLGGTKTAYMC